MERGVSLGTNQYGKAEIRMVALERDGERYDVRDLTVGVALSGDLAAVHQTGDNTHVVATDTMKNTAYAFAREAPVGAIEEFALRLARHFVAGFAPIARARVRVDEHPWERLAVGGEPHPHAFARPGGETRTTTVVCDEAGEWVVSGLGDLVVLKATDSEFTGFVRDRYTTLEETRQRILATAVTARWRFATAPGDWDAAFAAARGALLEAFATTYSRSLQQSLYAMAEAALARIPELAEVRMSLPNRHHFLVDLSPFGLDNDHTVFHADDRPYGLIEASVVKDGAPPPGPAWDPYPLVS